MLCKLLKLERIQKLSINARKLSQTQQNSTILQNSIKLPNKTEKPKTFSIKLKFHLVPYNFLKFVNWCCPTVIGREPSPN